MHKIATNVSKVVSRDKYIYDKIITEQLQRRRCVIFLSYGDIIPQDSQMQNNEKNLLTSIGLTWAGLLYVNWPYLGRKLLFSNIRNILIAFSMSPGIAHDVIYIYIYLYLYIYLYIYQYLYIFKYIYLYLYLYL